MQILKEQYENLKKQFFSLSEISSNKKSTLTQPIEKYIDQTLLKPDATENQILEVCVGAKKNGFKTVCIQPCHVNLAAENLRGSQTLPITVIGFPLGLNKTEIKIAETFSAIRDGAKEIDMVINLNWAKSQMFDKILEEIYLVKKACGKTPLKVIIETSYLTREDKISLCACVEVAGADYIKTSTGFSGKGAEIEDIILFKKLLDGRVKIKASGGIKNYDQALAFIEAGADRLGTSSGPEILSQKKSTSTKDSY